VSYKKSAAIFLMLATLALCLPAQEKKPEWKDRAEYDLYDSITKTTDANAWLDTLNRWSAQYPQSDFADVRRKMYLETYRTLDRPREAFNAAVEVLKDNPNNLVALSVIVGFVSRLNPPTAADLEIGEKAASTILNNLDAIYSKDNRPQTMTDADAAKAKPDLKVYAQRTLGWVAYTRKDWPKAETELNRVLQLDPNQGQVSYWLGVTILEEAQPDKQPIALYHFARAAAYDGPGALSPTDRQQVQTYLNSVYKKYHGSADGLDKLTALAKTNAMPPRDLSSLIKSAAAIEKERIDAEEAAAKANPMLALWKSIKKELTSDNGQAYFDANMKGAALPAGVNLVVKFKGKLVSMTPAVRPKELVLAIENSEVPDATLKLDSALPGKMEPGADLEFEGVAVSYTKDPFMVTFEVEKNKLAGWTGKNETKKSGGATTKKSGTTANKKSF
jgi:tetratricopeptide (TPR) repeat protein